MNGSFCNSCYVWKLWTQFGRILAIWRLPGVQLKFYKVNFMFRSSSYFISISTMALNSSVPLIVSSCQPRCHFVQLLCNSSYFLKSGPNQLCEILIQGKHSGDRVFIEVVHFTFPLKSKYIKSSYIQSYEWKPSCPVCRLSFLSCLYDCQHCLIVSSFFSKMTIYHMYCRGSKNVH